MKFSPAKLEGVFLVQTEPRRDERGFLARTFCESEFAAHGLNTRWVQHNHTLTLQRGSVRGLHFQAEPLPEIKLVRCLAGRVWDVVVDVRPESPTRGNWESFELSSETQDAVYIPAGFAHGFQCLEDRCELFYLMSAAYEAPLARGLRWDDPDVAISWPLPIINLSPRDLTLPALKDLT